MSMSVNDTIAFLKMCDNRETAIEILNHYKKSELYEIAMANDLTYLRKSDTKKRIIEKIVQTLVDVRLRYKAIREVDIRYRR
jgi:hypothetical protein